MALHDFATLRGKAAKQLYAAKPPDPQPLRTRFPRGNLTRLAAPPSSLRREFKGIQKLNSEWREIGKASSHDGETICFGDRGDSAVFAKIV